MIKEVLLVTDALQRKVGEKVLVDVNISFFETRTTNVSDKLYASLVFSDKDTSVDAVHWGLTPVSKAFYETHDYARVQAEVSEFNGKKQLKVLRLEAIPLDDLDISKLKKVAPIPVEYMVLEIEDVIDNLKDEGIRLVTKNRWEKNKPNFIKWVAAKSMHHNYETGLLYHTYSMMQIARNMVTQYPENSFDADIVLAAIILHDMEKTMEYAMDGTKVSITEVGNLFGHIFLSAHKTLKTASDLKNTEEYKHVNFTKIQPLVHAILAHHGKLEYGSPVVPKTKEAEMVHQIDMMDSRMGMSYGS